MKTYHFVPFNRRSQMPSDLQAQLQEIAETHGGITALELVDDVEGRRAFVGLMCDKANRQPQKVLVVGISTRDAVAKQMNEELEVSGNREVRAITMLPITGDRAIGIIVTEADGSTKEVDSEGSKETPRKQNKKANAKSDPGAEA